jgi:hypothetical protein
MTAVEFTLNSVRFRKLREEINVSISRRGSGVGVSGSSYL